MNHISHNKIRRAVMRRVYMIFAGRLVSHPVTVNLALFAVALTVFREAVFVKRVVETLINTPLGQIPDFFLHALMRGEVVTFAALGIMTFTVLSLATHLKSLRFNAWQSPVVSA